MEPGFSCFAFVDYYEEATTIVVATPVSPMENVVTKLEVMPSSMVPSPHVQLVQLGCASSSYAELADSAMNANSQGTLLDS